MKPDPSKPDPLKPEILERLGRHEIRVMAQGEHFCVFVRDNCLAMVPCEEGMFLDQGSTGLSMDCGLGYLVVREGQPLLVGNTFEIPAEPDQVARIQQFSADVKVALGFAG